MAGARMSPSSCKSRQEAGVVVRGQASGGSGSTERITNGGRISDRVWSMWIGNNETPSRKVGIMCGIDVHM